MFTFKVSHKHVGNCGCYACTHGCSSDLEEVIVRERMEEFEGSPIGILLGGRYWESQKATARQPSSFGILM